MSEQTPGWSDRPVPPPGWTSQGGPQPQWPSQDPSVGWGGSWPSVPPPYAAPPPSERFRLAWQGRYSTDYIFQYWSALGWTILTIGIYSLYVFYQLMRRMRDHNRRRLELLDAALAFGWEVAGRQGLQEELTPSFQRGASHLAELRDMTSDFRDPVVWLLISLVARGLAELIAFILLDQDLVRHDRAELGVEYELALIYGRLGQPLPFPDPTRVKGPHNYVGRVIASVFTIGLYLFWWYYNMMSEPNRHFQTNWVQEDALAGAVQRLL